MSNVTIRQMLCRDKRLFWGTTKICDKRIYRLILKTWLSVRVNIKHAQTRASPLMHVTPADSIKNQVSANKTQSLHPVLTEVLKAKCQYQHTNVLQRQ